MKMNKKIAYCLIGSLLFSTVFSSCGKKNDKKTEAAIEIADTATMGDAEEIQVFYKEGCVINELTGEWIDEKLEKKRPVAIMINNISDAMPQSGIQQADITYEFPVEGGITRYLCVFKDYSGVEKLGPVRSARHYYVYTAMMMDAIYAHFGWSIFAEDLINKTGYDNLNGLVLGDIMYYRDNSRVAPHNVYTSGELIQNGIDYKEYRVDHEDSFEQMFNFYNKDTKLDNGTTATKVTLPFSSYQTPWFDYNKEDGLYYRSQYGDKQIDAETGEQLHYKNILVLSVKFTEITDGLLDADLSSKGKGYYITNGEYQSIKWKRSGDIMEFTTEDGKELKMNPGNTFIEVMKTKSFKEVTIE